MKALWFWCIFSFSLFVSASQVENIQFSTGDNSLLKAQIFSPPASKSKRPAILIIEGRGKFVPNVPYDQLASQLSQQGFIVLTYSRRGVGENAASGSAWKTTFTSDNQDAQYALNYLKSHAQVDSKKLFILGHCLGGIQALKLTEKNDLAGVILVTSTIRSFSDVQLEQRRITAQFRGWSKKKVDESIQTLSKQIQQIKSGTYKCVAPECQYKDGVEVVDGSLPLPWWEEALRLDFTDWALKSRAPIYFIFGSSDFISPKSDYYYVRDLIRINKTHHIESRYLSHLDHFLVENKNDKESFKYLEQMTKADDSKLVSDELVGEVATWIRHKL